MQKIYIRPYVAFDNLEPDVYYEIPYDSMNTVRPLYELNLKAGQIFYTHGRTCRKYIPSEKRHKYQSKAYFFIGKDGEENKIQNYTTEKLENLMEQCKAKCKLVKYDKATMLKKKEYLQEQLVKVNEELNKVEHDIKNSK